MEEIRAGSYQAFEELFHAHYDDLVAFANRLIRKPEVAEELVQEVFYNTWKGRHNWRPQGSPRAYLFGAARNSCLNYIRRQKVASRVQSHVLAWIHDEGERPDRAFEYEEFSQAVQHAINALPEKRREVFIMSRQQGLSYAEIAALLDISVNTVENQMVNAMKFLRRRLSAYLSGRV